MSSPLKQNKSESVMDKIRKSIPKKEYDRAMSKKVIITDADRAKTRKILKSGVITVSESLSS